jgi:anti-sigma B factor antagonist
MDFSTQCAGAQAVVTARGELDVATSPALRDCLLGLIGDGTRELIVDLTEVDFVDSTALGVLVGVFKRLRENGGTFALVCPHERLLKVFRVTALDRVFAMRKSVPAAFAELPPTTSTTSTP